MAQLWMQTDSKRWGYYPLEAQAFSLSALPPSPLDPGEPAGETSATETTLLSRTSQGDWVLMTGKARRAWVNGMPVALGVRVLRHQDRITVEDVGTAFLSTETLPCIESFPEDAAPGSCPRCRLAIEVGSPAVQCGCGIWYHESEEFPCFSCAPTCVFCDRTAELGSGFRWLPEAP